jgi:hypothetical protein
MENIEQKINETKILITTIYKKHDIKSVADAVLILPSIMETVESTIKLSGEDKKKLVMDVVLSLISNKDAKSIADVILPYAIDVIISTSKGLYKLQQSCACTKKCSSMFCCLKK